jgi:hypothetical protein
MNNLAPQLVSGGGSQDPGQCRYSGLTMIPAMVDIPE